MATLAVHFRMHIKTKVQCHTMHLIAHPFADCLLDIIHRYLKFTFFMQSSRLTHHMLYTSCQFLWKTSLRSQICFCFVERSTMPQIYSFHYVCHSGSPIKTYSMIFDTSKDMFRLISVTELQYFSWNAHWNNVARVQEIFAPVWALSEFFYLQFWLT